MSSDLEEEEDMTVSLRHLVVSAVAVSLGTSAMADLIQIQMSGVNLTYSDADGGGLGTGQMVNAGAPTDPLNNLDFLIDDALVGGFGFADDLDFEFSVLSIPNIAVPLPGSTTSVTAFGNGSLELLIGGSSILAIDLSMVEVSYSVLNIGPSMFHFQFTGAVGTTSSQSLPFGLLIGDSIQISFSQQGTTTQSGGFLTGFTGSGTGELSGQLVPAPGALAILGLAGLLGRTSRRRK